MGFLCCHRWEIGDGLHLEFVLLQIILWVVPCIMVFKCERMRKGLFAYPTCKFVLLFDVFYILPRVSLWATFMCFLRFKLVEITLWHMMHSFFLACSETGDGLWFLISSLRNGGNQNKRGNFSSLLFLNRKFLRHRGCCCLRLRYLYGDLLRLR